MTEDRRGRHLKVIRDLLARAASTEFEPEREACLAKADELQTKFQIEEWELSFKQDDAGARKAIRRDMDMSWYFDEHKSELRSALWSMFIDCAQHCRVVPAGMKTDSAMKIIPVFGLAADLDYLDLLFTNLFMQMIAKVKPKFDPSKSIGFNVYQAKEAGMTYHQIANWAGHPEWITIKGYSKKGNPQYQYNGIMIREMKKYARESGQEVHQEVSLKSYFRDFCWAFVYAVDEKLRQMRDDQGQSSGSMSIALRDMALVSREAMWDEFPDLRPHPADCSCESCHTAKCTDPQCQRPRCVERRKPIKASKFKEERISLAAQARGLRAGREANIVGRGGDGLRAPKQLG